MYRLYGRIHNVIRIRQGARECWMMKRRQFAGRLRAVVINGSRSSSSCEHCQRFRKDSDGIQDADVREKASITQLVNGCVADAQPARDFTDREQVTRLNLYSSARDGIHLFRREQNRSKSLRCCC